MCYEEREIKTGLIVDWTLVPKGQCPIKMRRTYMAKVSVKVKVYDINNDNIIKEEYDELWWKMNSLVGKELYLLEHWNKKVRVLNFYQEPHRTHTEIYVEVSCDLSVSELRELGWTEEEIERLLNCEEVRK